MKCKCGQDAHPIYGKQCEDCYIKSCGLEQSGVRQPPEGNPHRYGNGRSKRQSDAQKKLKHGE